MSAEKLLFIDGVDAFVEWGVSIKKGSLSEFLKNPERKIGYSKDWPEEPGTEYDPDEPFVPKTLDYSVTLNFTSGNVDDFNRFNKYLQQNRLMSWNIPSLDRKYVLMYVNSTGTDLQQFNGDYYGEMTVLLRNNFEKKSDDNCI